MIASPAEPCGGRMTAALCAFALAWLAAPASAQVSTRPVIGIQDRTPQLRAFTHARLVIAPGKVVKDGTLVVRDGVIRAAGTNARIPAGAARIDLKGKTVYAGFIEPLSNYGQSGKPDQQAHNEGDRTSPSTPDPRAGTHSWNAKVHPELDIAEQARPDAGKAEDLRALGFTDVLSVPQHGVLRGQGALLDLADGEDLNQVLITPRVAQMAAFEVNGWGSAEYPGSLMGAIALVRQTLYDARWQVRRSDWAADNGKAERSERNRSLGALEPLLDRRQPLIFATEDELDYDRALAIAREFKLNLVLAGNGHEYRMAPKLKQAGVPVIVPLKLPEAPKVEDPDRALDVTLAELEHFKWAPYNARILAEAGVPFAFTASTLDKPRKEFLKRVRELVGKGLTPDAALAALTTQPASMLGVGDTLGSLEPGHLAHFIVADRDLLRDKSARIYETWIDGHRYQHADLAEPNPRGQWSLDWRGAQGPSMMTVSGDDKLKVKAGGKSFPASQDGQRLLLYFPGALLGSGLDRVSVVATLSDETLSGRADLGGDRRLALSGRLTRPAANKRLAAWSKPPLPDVPLRFPAGAHGRRGVPDQPAAVLVHNARIWTQGPQGILQDADLLVEHGRISAVGANLSAPSNALEIDAQGKQVTPGIVDAHSHIAIARGVNEGTHAVTSEVRIGDVLDPTDMIIYRQLAGGTTTAMVLHGSANPIGGQSQIIKLRWGADADGLKFRRAPETIKFALGENVKQSNWGEKFTTRYPQTRMGVEQIDIDSLLAAQTYGAAVKAGHAEDGGPLRRDLRLEALWEVLEGKRLVQIHSYRQDEILAFIRTAERFHFVPLFQHGLEGYKVADALAHLGAGVSTFSDWWAYKYEVIDAIPYNGALMTRQGVTVSFNSDDDELGRRLNTEAAKSIKYGGLSPVQALNLVTLNPARQLHIDKYVGSLEPGKDADFVIWDDDPLSTQAKPLQTWVDGRRYFDSDQDHADDQRVEAERQRLIAAALPERVKELKQERKDEGGDKGAEDERPAAVGLLDRDDLFCALLAQRSIYHDSTPAAGCAEAGARR